jgi:hypothetical protein
MGRRSHSVKLSLVAIGGVALALLGSQLVTVGTPTASAAPGHPRVFYVGTYKGLTTSPSVTFSTIQAAVNAAKRGDTILVAPGDYHEAGDMGANAPSPSDISSGWYGGVDINTPNLTIRGMDRSSTIVDGTLSSASGACSSAPADQNTLGGLGRNGILVWKAANVHVDNLTVCNFLAGTGSAGNEVWWNGQAAPKGPIGVKGYEGSYLTATSSYFANSDPTVANACSSCALYGIFASNASNGKLDQTYANNFSDSGLYIGACRRSCNTSVSNAWMEYNALGYSGTNSGGQLVIQNSMFDNNKDGIDTNTQLVGDPPPPQDGRCPGKAISPLTGTTSCWVFQNNLVAYNNNPNVPVQGSAGLGPTGTGMTISGGRFDTVQNNKFLGNGAWGILFAPYPSTAATSGSLTCQNTGGITSAAPIPAAIKCLYDAQGDSLKNNQFSGNGSFGNPTNADFGNLAVAGGQFRNCFSGNTLWDSTFTTLVGPATSANADLSLNPVTCGPKAPKAGLLGSQTDLTLLVQAECDAGVLTGCSTGYPQPISVTMKSVPSTLPTMPNPCIGTPSNVWCPGGVPAAPIKKVN